MCGRLMPPGRSGRASRNCGIVQAPSLAGDGGAMSRTVGVRTGGARPAPRSRSGPVPAEAPAGAPRRTAIASASRPSRVRRVASIMSIIGGAFISVDPSVW
jgi:hypothetical protein